MALPDNFANRMAQALQGFGAGVEGRGPEFLAQLSEARKQAMLQDAVAVHQDLQSGNLGQARERLLERRDHILRLGGDPSDTDRLQTKIDAALAGDEGALDSALEDTGTFLEGAYQRGYLDRPPEKIARMDADQIERDLVTKEEGIRLRAAELEQRANAKVTDPVKLAEEKARIKLDTEKQLSDVQVKTAREKARATGLVERETQDITSGLQAAQNIPALNRTRALLDIVGTGKPEQAKRFAKNILGIESANEVELHNKLGKAVIAQIRPIFGAQPTAKEGFWLESMSANWGRSDEGNKRLIEQGLVLARARAEQGLVAAEAAGDLRTADNIRGWRDMNLDPELYDQYGIPKPGAKMAPPQGTATDRLTDLQQRIRDAQLSGQ